MNKFIRILEWIWLSKNHSIIYLKLLEYWKSTITDISEITLLHRTQLYRLLPYLIESGFVIVTLEWKKKYYFPASPSIINDAYLELQSQTKSSLSTLENMYENIDKKPIVTYNQGKNWITNLFNDIVESTKKWDVFYRVTSEVDTDFINKNYLPKEYREKRDKKDLERYVIMSSKSAKSKKNRLERELKVIPESIDEFQDDILMTIYANKVWFIDFNTETSIIIENKQIAEFQKKLFKLLYKSLK